MPEFLWSNCVEKYNGNKMDKNTTTADDDGDVKSISSVDTDDILLEILSERKVKGSKELEEHTTRADRKLGEVTKGKSEGKEKKKFKGKKSKPIKKQSSRKQLKKNSVENVKNNLPVESASGRSRQNRPKIKIGDSSSQEIKLDKSDAESNRSSSVNSTKNFEDFTGENTADVEPAYQEFLLEEYKKENSTLENTKEGQEPNITQNTESNENVRDLEDEQSLERVEEASQEVDKNLKQVPPITIPDVSEESMLFTDLLVTKRSGSEWEKLVQNTAYSPGSTIQLMRAASIKRRHMSDPDATADMCPTAEFSKPTFTFSFPQSQEQVPIDDDQGSGSPGSPPFPGNMFKFGSKRGSLLPPINQSGQMASLARRTSTQKIPFKSPGVASLNLSVKLPKLEPVKRRGSLNVAPIQQQSEHPEWPKPTKIGKGWRILRRHIIAGMFGYSLNRIRVSSSKPIKTSRAYLFLSDSPTVRGADLCVCV